MLLNCFHAFLQTLNPRRTQARIRRQKRNRFHWKRTAASGIAALESLEERTLLSSTSFIYNDGGYLTGPSTADAETIARGYLSAHPDVLGVTSSDVSNLILTDRTTGSQGTVTNLYFQQTYQGIPIDAGTTNLTIDSQGRVISIGNRLVSDVSSKVVAGGASLSPAQAIYAAAADLNAAAPSGVLPAGSTMKYNNEVRNFSGGSLSKDLIPVKQVYNLGSDGKLHLAWNTVINMTTSTDWFYINVDATTGAQLYLNNWTIDDDFNTSASGQLGGSTSGGSSAGSSSGTSSASLLPGGNSGSPGSQFATGDSNSNAGTGTYNVYPLPITAPNDGSRSVITDPQDYRASPYGWHDTNGTVGPEYTTTQGNNVFAQEDADHNNTGGFSPDGGPSLNFNFGLDLTQTPTSGTNQSAEITQLFYTVNMLHDIHYQYGFDEASGNFQVNNYGKGGTGNDQVLADAQDGSGLNNANFGTPPDGTSGRMQMYIWNQTSPNRDGDLSMDIIIHEFGHGVSNRLTGGPANSNALSARQSGGMGEGWSDWWSLMFTQRPSDAQMDAYPMATWVLGQTNADKGLRHFPYSYDMKINPLTYGNYNVSSEVHDSGEIWTSVLWDLNWLYINRYGYSSDLYDGNGGNNMLLQTVMDALKIQPVTPTFLDARDAILAADQASTGGANRDLIWEAFARRGMGVNAYDGGGPNALLVAENFDVPADLAAPTDDHANTAVQATLVNSHSLTSGVIDTLGDVDYFRFYATAGEHFDINVRLPSDNFTPLTDSTLTLYDVDGTTQLAFDDDGGDGLASYLSFNAPATGTYFLKVTAYNDQYIGPYVLDMLHDDAGNTAATATPTRFQSKQGGEIETGGDVDYYSFTATAGQHINFQTYLITLGDTTLTLYDTDGTTQLAFNDDWNASAGQYFSGFGYTFSTAGTYYLKVAGYDSSYLGTYGLYIYNTGSDYDNIGNDRISASMLGSPGGSANGKIEVDKDVDWFGYYLFAGKKYNFTTTLGTLDDSTLTMFDHDGRTQVGFNDDIDGLNLASSLNFAPQHSGYYYLQVAGFQALGVHTGTYTLQSSDITDDHADIYQAATPVGVHSLTNGNLETEGDFDYFTFHAVAGLVYDLDTDRLTLNDSRMTVFGPDGITQVAYDDGGASGTGVSPHITFTAAETGEFFVRIQGYGSSDTGTYTLAVNEHNGAPVLLDNLNFSIPTISEDPVAATNTGMLISDFIASFPAGQLTDPNAGALQGLGISQVDNTHGIWQFSSNNGSSWLNIGAVSDTNVRLLPSSPGWRIRFVPAANYNGDVFILYYGWDQTAGTAGGLINGTIRGGETSLSQNYSSAQVTITAVQDAPILNPTGNPALPSIPEDTFNSVGMSIKDLIASTALGASYITDPDAGAVQGIALYAAPSSGGNWQYSLNNGGTWTTLSGLSQTNALLLDADAAGNNRLRFVPLTNFNGTRQVYFRAWDETSGTSGSFANITVNGGTSAFSLKADSATITVTPVNDAPQLFNTYNPVVPTVNKTATNNPGFKVSAMIASTNPPPPSDYITDVDGGVEGIAIYSIQDVGGHWEYSLTNGTPGSWVSIGAVAANNALLLKSDASTYLRFVPNGTATGDRKIFFRAWDQSSGTAGTKVDATVTGGTTAFSVGADSLTLTVNTVNDAPVLNTAGSPTLPTIPKTNSNPAGISILDLIASGGANYITDLESTDPKGIAIYGAPNSGGTWEYSLDSGAHWTSIGTVDQSNSLLLKGVASTMVRFRPLSTFTGVRSISFAAWDQSSGVEGTKVDTNTRGGTTAFSSARDTASITVTT